MPQLCLKTGGPEAAGHGGEVFALAFAPDGNLLLSGGWDGHLRLWDVSSGASLAEVHASAKAISAVAVSPDGRQWLAGALDGMLSSWDPATHQQLSAVLAHTRPISAILFSADGLTLATASWDRSLGLWSRVQDRTGRVLVGHDDVVAGCRFTPDGRQLFSWSHDGTARAWDLARGQAVVTLQGHADRVTAGAVAPDGLWAATGARDRVLTLWDLATGKPLRSACLGDEVRGCFFLPDGESLVSIDAAGRAALHALADLSERQELATGRPVLCAEAAPDGKTIALGCDDGRVRFVTVDGVEAAPLLVTPTRAEPPTPSRWQRLFGGRRPARAYACTCPGCRHAFQVSDGALGQPASCPACRRALRLSQVARPA